jgi:hypothetical protein
MTVSTSGFYEWRHRRFGPAGVITAITEAASCPSTVLGYDRRRLVAAVTVHAPAM